MGEAASSLDALIFSCHSIKELAELRGTVEAFFTLGDVSEFTLVGHVASLLVEELLSTTTSVAEWLALLSWISVEATKWVEKTFSSGDALGATLLSVRIRSPVRISGCLSSTWNCVSSLAHWKIAVTGSKRSVADWVVVEKVEFSVAAAFGLATRLRITYFQSFIVVIIAVDHVLGLDELASV